jgi:pimeloyl-ACP methyl ester carboxylesterase
MQSLLMGIDWVRSPPRLTKPRDVCNCELNSGVLRRSKLSGIERLIFIDTPPTPGTTLTILTDAYFDPVIGELLSHFQTDRAVRKGLAQGFAPGFPVPEKFVADIRQLTYSAFREAHDGSVKYRTLKPPFERLAALSPVPPLLAMTGALDAIVPPEHLKFYERVPGSEVAIIEGAGHSPMVEKPAKTLELIRHFMRPTS